MNKSFSKIRHIQEANRVLENRLLSEQPYSDVNYQRGLNIPLNPKTVNNNTNQKSQKPVPQQPKTKIVEPTEDKPLTVKFFNSQGEKDAGRRAGNIQLFPPRLSTEGLYFRYKWIEGNAQGEASFNCDIPNEPIQLKDSVKIFLSDEVTDWLQSKCNDAVSTGTPSSNMA